MTYVYIYALTTILIYPSININIYLYQSINQFVSFYLWG